MYFFFVLVFILLLSFAIFYRFYFLRKPKRFPFFDDRFFVSPASGTVIAVAYSEKEILELCKWNKKVCDLFVWDVWKKVSMISIMLSLTDVHCQRASADCKLLDSHYVPGKFFNAVTDSRSMKATFQNEHNQMLFQSASWTKFKIIQIAWFLARRIIQYASSDASYQKWDLIGFITMGSQVTVVFDDTVSICVEVWQTLIDWESIIAVKK